MIQILNRFKFDNPNKVYPLVEVKYANNGANPITIDFKYDIHNIAKIAVDEMFTYIDDRVLNNIVSERYTVTSYGRIFDRVK